MPVQTYTVVPSDANRWRQPVIDRSRCRASKRDRRARPLTVCSCGPLGLEATLQRNMQGHDDGGSLSALVAHWLADGTEYFGRPGQLAYDESEDTVQCHLCGRCFRPFGGSHLRRTHGRTLAEYRVAFQLRATTPTVAAGTSEALAANTRRRVAARELPAPPAPQHPQRSAVKEPGDASRRAVPWPRTGPRRHPLRAPPLEPLRCRVRQGLRR
jgi:hypothetical protein